MILFKAFVDRRFPAHASTSFTNFFHLSSLLQPMSFFLLLIKYWLVFSLGGIRICLMCNFSIDLLKSSVPHVGFLF